MSFFSEASLAMIPSGYKTSKVYSALPITGDGDLTFSRSNDTATRVGPNGYIEKVRTNLLLQSQTFDNASWTKTTDGQVTITANAAVAPDGTTTAEKMIPSAIAGFHCVAQTITLSASEVSVSIFAKAAENSFLQIFDSLTTEFANFNLTTGVVGSTDTYVASIESVGNGWYRCKATKAAPSGSFVLRYGVVTSASAVRGESFTGNGTDGLLIWGAQAETGVTTDYIATTTTAVSVGPVANVPRLDYLDSTSPRLLLEPQRTNLLQYSEQLNNAYWTPDGATITANTAVAPDGTTSMDRLTETATTNPHQVISTAVTIFGGAARTFSVFVKKGNVRYIQIANVAFGASSASSIFDLDTKTVTDSRASSGAGPAFSFVSASVEDYGNGILRLILVNTCSFDSPTYRIAHSNQATFTGATLVDGMVSYAGNASSFTDIWGCGLESASYATSYIPTLGASVTRGADTASKTSISSLIGQTEGTMFVEFAALSGANDDRTITINDGTTSNRVAMALLSNGTQIQFVVQSGGSVVMNSTQTISGLTTGVKIAYAYKLNDFAVYVNGSLLVTDTNGAVPVSMSAFSFDAGNGSDIFFGKVNQALLFTSRLSDADLAALTA